MGLLDSLKSGGVKGLANAAADMASEAAVAKKDQIIAQSEAKQIAKDNARTMSRQFVQTAIHGGIAIDSNNRLMKIKACIPVEKSGMRKFGEVSAAVMTAGLSLAVTAPLGKPKDCIIGFDELRGYELMEDDSIVAQSVKQTSGAGAVVGNVGFGSAATTGTSVTSKTIDSLMLRIDVNDIDNPALFVSYISKRTKRTGKEYQKAMQDCHKAMQCLDMIMNGMA